MAKNWLKKYQKGGKLTPIYVDSPNDPRYRAYQDSLILSNRLLEDKGCFPGSKWAAAYDRLTKLNKEEPHTDERWGEDSISVLKYPAPKQPVIVGNKLEKLPTITNKYTPQSLQQISLPDLNIDTRLKEWYSNSAGVSIDASDEEVSEKLYNEDGSPKYPRGYEQGGKISTTGYKADSPDRNEPILTIPSNRITMQGVDYPVMAYPSAGKGTMMHPGAEYYFPYADYVTEVPVAQNGWSSSDLAKLREANANFKPSPYQDMDPAMLQQYKDIQHAMQLAATPQGRVQLKKEAEDKKYTKKKREEATKDKETRKELQEQYARERFADDPSVINPAYWQTDPITGRTPQQRLDDMGTDLQTRVFRGGTNWLDNLNPGVWTAGMAGNLAKAPLRAQQENSAMPYVSAIGEPLVFGAGEEIVAPYLKKIFGKAPVNYGESNVGSQAMPKIHTDLYPKDGRYYPTTVITDPSVKIYGEPESIVPLNKKELPYKRVPENPNERYVAPATGDMAATLKEMPELSAEDKIWQSFGIKPRQHKYLELNPLTKEEASYTPRDIRNTEINKVAEQYYNLTQDPRYLERAKNLDKEYGTNFESMLKNLKEQHDNPKLVSKFEIENRVHGNPFNIYHTYSTEPGSGKGAFQLFPNVAEEYVQNQYTSKGLSSNYNKAKQFYEDEQYHPKYGAITLDEVATPYDEIKRIIPHEMKHYWTAGLQDPKGEMYAHFIDRPNVMKSGFLEGKEWTQVNGKSKYDPHVAYFQTPTEYDAHVNTNFRQDLVDAGTLKDHFDELTVEKLNKFIEKNPNNPVVINYFDKGLIGDKDKMVKMFNKALPVVLPGVVGTAFISQKENKKYGGTIKNNWLQNY